MSAPVRYSIHGHRMEGSIFTSECGDCGMPTLGMDEFHPYEACAAYKDTHSSVYVERLIEPLEHVSLISSPRSADVAGAARARSMGNAIAAARVGGETSNQDKSRPEGRLP